MKSCAKCGGKLTKEGRCKMEVQLEKEIAANPVPLPLPYEDVPIGDRETSVDLFEQLYVRTGRIKNPKTLPAADEGFGRWEEPK